MLGHLTDGDFLGIAHSKVIANCPVTLTALQNAHPIFGPNLAGVRGETVRRPPEYVISNYFQMPRVFLEQHQRVTLAVNVMFLNVVPIFASVSRDLN
jgi:hypothetical protein